MKKIYITGVSGTGKTTIANKLKEEGLRAYSIDEVPSLCYWINKNDGKKVDYEAVLDNAFISSHEWICNIEKLKNLLNTEGTTVVLGHAENEGEFLPLFDKIILLQCKPEIFLKRIMDREDNVFGKDKSAQEYLLNTYQRFESDMLDRGAISIDVDKPLDEVISLILKEII